MGTPDCGDDCLETLEEITRFLDGETTEITTLTIERHLSDCSPCMDRAEFRRALKVLIANKCGTETVPVELRERIELTIRTTSTST